MVSVFHTQSSSLLIIQLSCSEWSKFAVFLKLLKLVPSLECCLISSDEEEVVAIADMVSGIHYDMICWLSTLIDPERCQQCQGWWHKRHEVHDHRLDHFKRSNTQSAYSTKCKVWSRLSPLAHYFVQLVMIGLIPSMSSIQPKLNNPLIIWFMAGSKRSCTQDSFVSQAINDPSSCMWTIHMIPKILGMAYCTAGYWYWQISFSYAWLWTYWQILPTQAYKHIFTSPSSVDVEEPRATHSCNT